MSERGSNKSKLRLEYEHLYPDFDTKKDSDIPAYIPWIELKLQQLEAKLAEIEKKVLNPTCHRGHSHYPLTLWDCPTCVQNEKKELEAEIQRLRVRVLGDGITRLEALEKNADEKSVALIDQKIEMFEKINIELLKSNLSSIAMVDASGQIALDYIVQLETKLAETTKTGEALIDERDDIIASFEAEITKLNYIELPNEKTSNVFEAYLAWKSKATQLEADNVALQRQVDGLKKLVAMSTIEDLPGIFNHYIEMQKQAIHGQSGASTVKFWKDQAGKQLKIIEIFEALEAGVDVI